jgi:hypothetical protein
LFSHIIKEAFSLNNNAFDSNVKISNDNSSLLKQHSTSSLQKSPSVKDVQLLNLSSQTFSLPKDYENFFVSELAMLKLLLFTIIYNSDVHLTSNDQENKDLIMRIINSINLLSDNISNQFILSFDTFINFITVHNSSLRPLVVNNFLSFGYLQKFDDKKLNSSIDFLTTQFNSSHFSARTEKIRGLLSIFLKDSICSYLSVSFLHLLSNKILLNLL